MEIALSDTHLRSVLRAARPWDLHTADPATFRHVVTRLSHRKQYYDDWEKIARLATVAGDRALMGCLASMPLNDDDPDSDNAASVAMALAHGLLLIAGRTNEVATYNISAIGSPAYKDVTVPLSVPIALMRTHNASAAKVVALTVAQGRYRAVSASADATVPVTDQEKAVWLRWMDANDPDLEEFVGTLNSLAQAAEEPLNAQIARSVFASPATLATIATNPRSTSDTVIAAVRRKEFPGGALPHVVTAHGDNVLVLGAVIAAAGSPPAALAAQIADRLVHAADGATEWTPDIGSVYFAGIYADATPDVLSAATRWVKATLTHDALHIHTSTARSLRAGTVTLLNDDRTPTVALSGLTAQWMAVLTRRDEASRYRNVRKKELADLARDVAEAALSRAARDDAYLDLLQPWLATLVRRPTITLTDIVITRLADHPDPKIKDAAARRITKALFA